MANLGCRDVGEYVAVLQSSAEEQSICQAHLRVTISRFFRDRQVWHQLERRLLPKLASRFLGIAPNEETFPLRAWSAGCACGEEPYSLAIVRQRLKLTNNLFITATDGDAVCLNLARRGVYQRSSLKELAEDTISECFQKLSKGRFAIQDVFRENIIWRQHDLFDAPPPGPFHVIMLRNNLLTYYQGEKLQRGFKRIVESLEPGGILVVGSHESPPEKNISLQRDDYCPLIFHRSF